MTNNIEKPTSGDVFGECLTKLHRKEGKIQMYKKDVAIGNVVELRNGYRYLLVSLRGELQLINKTGFLFWGEYTDDLKLPRDEDFNVSKIYDAFGAGIDWMLEYGCNEGALIWQRPQCTIPEDTPIDTPVLFRDSDSHEWIRGFFAGIGADIEYPYECFDDGGTKWSSYGEKSKWKQCILVEDSAG